MLDSTFDSLIVNLGYFVFSVYSILYKSEPLFALLIIVLLYSVTTIIFEVYPVNLFLAILVIFFIKGGSCRE